MSDRRHDRIAELARIDAENKAESAAYGGRMDDGGARFLNAIVDAWEAGLRGAVPSSLAEYESQEQRESDPEWREYRRLQAKFEEGRR